MCRRDIWFIRYERHRAYLIDLGKCGDVRLRLVTEGRERIVQVLREHPQPIPSDRFVTVEDGGEMVIINATFGSRVNRTLGTLISALLAARTGSSVSMQFDPYRIVITSGVRTAPYVTELLENIEPESIDYLLRRYLANSSEMKWHLVRVAKTFGAMPKSVDITRISLSSIIGRFRNTIIFEEAMESFLFNYLDVRGAEKALEGIRSGSIGLKITPLSPLGRSGFDRRGDLMRPERSTRAILRGLERRLMRQRLLMICLSCHSMWSVTPSWDRDCICRRCGSVMVGAIQADRAVGSTVRKILESRRSAKSLVLTANLVKEHRGAALLALAARGVGPRTAARLLRHYEDRIDLLKRILEAEISYARTRRFWDTPR